jgi:hypothetical protein
MLVGVDADVAPVALAAAAAVGIGGGGVVAAVSAVLGGGPLAGAVVGAVVDIRGAVSYSYGRLTDSTGCEIDWKCESVERRQNTNWVAILNVSRSQFWMSTHEHFRTGTILYVFTALTRARGDAALAALK